MGTMARDRIARLQRGLASLLRRTEVVALFPMLVLLAYETGGARLVVAAAMILPTLLVLQNMGAPASHREVPAIVGQPPGREAVFALLGRLADIPDANGACLLVEIDDWSALQKRWGNETSTSVIDRCRNRLDRIVRSTDLLGDLGNGQFAVIIQTTPTLRLGQRDTMASRLQSALSEPLTLGSSSVRLTACVGHTSLFTDVDDPAGTTMAAAQRALRAAQSSGPNSVRAHSNTSTVSPADRMGLAPDVAPALETGAIRPWFQPQIDVRTGAVTGFEALARWHHPRLGLVGPVHLLPAVAEAGAMAAFSAAIRQHALSAVSEWGRLGWTDLTVSINASAEELRSPTYAEQIAWDLDGAEIDPARLIVEVLETVAATSQDDAVMKTLAALRQQGVRLDLDDFGIGQASLLSIRRFGVTRIKIDRSFVIGVDSDTEQRAMVGVIVSLAREMGLATLAEGVETAAERDALIELGCDALQGYFLAKPMPFEETQNWLASQSPEGMTDPAEDSAVSSAT